MQGILTKFNDAFDYLPLPYVMDFMKDDANTLEVQQGLDLLVVPCKGFTLPVDKEKVLANGIVSEKYADRILDELRWQLPNIQTIYKNDLMILDMVANFDWNRSIYFGSSTDRRTFLGLNKYFFSEGLVYKFVPIETVPSRNPNTLGEVNTDALYANLMEKFSWGNMNVEGVLVDYYSQRLTNNYRVQFSVLADAYVELIEQEKQKLNIMQQIAKAEHENPDAPIPTQFGTFIPSEVPSETKKSEAIIADAQTKINEVLDRAFEVMPHVNVPFKKVIPSYISTYYQAENEEKAQLYTNQMFDLYEEELNYYFDIDPKFSSLMIDDMFNTYRSIFSLFQSATVYSKDVAFQEEMNARFDAINVKVQAGTNNIRRENSATDKKIQQTFDAFFDRFKDL